MSKGLPLLAAIFKPSFFYLISCSSLGGVSLEGCFPQKIANEILRTGQFEIYVESNQYRSMGIMMDKEWKEKNKVFPNLNLKANVIIQNIDEVRACFDNKKSPL
jgi:hypothetical protein